MAAEKPLTKSELIAVLKEIGVATKSDVADIVHTQLTEYHANMIKPDIDELKTDVRELKADIQQLKQGQERLETGQKHLREDVKASLSDTPSRQEIDDLKVRVRKLEIAAGDL
jgi:outer membrane murein-binding lipoprotein Lpp